MDKGPREPVTKESESDTLNNSDSPSVVAENSEITTTAVDITLKNTEHVVIELAAESSGDSSPPTEDAVVNLGGNPVPVEASAGDASSESEHKLTDSQSGKSGDSSEDVEATGIELEVDTDTVNENDCEAENSLNMGDRDDVSAVDVNTGQGDLGTGHAVVTENNEAGKHSLDFSAVQNIEADTDSVNGNDSATLGSRVNGSVRNTNTDQGDFLNNHFVEAENETGAQSLDFSVVQRMEADPAYQKNVTSLMQLCAYGSESESEDSGEKQNTEPSRAPSENEVGSVIVNGGKSLNGGEPSSVAQKNYRKPVEVVSDTSDSEDSSEESSSSSSETTSSSDEVDEVVVRRRGTVKLKDDDSLPKTRGELSLQDLPPIEDLHISVPDSESVEIGHVMSIVDSLVVVQALKGSPPLDIDSVLFLEKGKRALGQVFDVFGPVVGPCYCVRFNSKEHAKEKGVEPGMPVYFAPRTEHANFVFVSDLMKVKGSDASWEDNNEPPERFIEYSDDEEERRARRVKEEVKKEAQPARRKKRPFRRVSQQNQEDQVPRFSSPFQGNPWASENAVRPFSPARPPPSPFQAGPQPLVRPPTLSTAPFMTLNEVDTFSQSPRINPWMAPSPRENASYSPVQQPFPPGPMGGFPPGQPMNFPPVRPVNFPPNANFPPPNSNFAPPNLNFAPPNANFAPPNSPFAPPNPNFPPELGHFRPVSPVSRFPPFPQPPPPPPPQWM